ncbi:MAG: NAD-dependent epimerase/dehydratase family protein [Actinomycetota bacterium]
MPQPKTRIGRMALETLKAIKTPRVTAGMVQRMVADVILVNIALALAIAVRFVALVWLGRTESGPDMYQRALEQSAEAFASAAPLLTIVCLVSFYLSGFYTRGRFYRGRYKALIVFQAVTLAYAIFAAATYLFMNVEGWFPRTVWLGGWILTLLLVGGSRAFARLWRTTLWREARIDGGQTRTSIRNVLVIGGAGYLGSVLVGKLLKRGYSVTVMDALVYGDEGIRRYHGRRNFQVIQGDLRDIEAVVRALQYADAVIHLGGLVGDPACAMDEKLTNEINLASTRLLAEVARGFGVQRFVFASSCSVYGASDEILDERSALDPVSVYAQTKKDSEKMLLDLEDINFAPTILRFGTLYGWSPRPRFDLVVNLLTAKALSEGRVTIFGGEQWRPFVHVDDAADSMMKCLQAPLAAVKGEVFNVGGDEENYRISDIGAMVCELVPGTEMLTTENGHEANYRVSFHKIRRYLDFKPQRRVADGIAEIKQAIELGLITEYQSSAYSNHRVLADDKTNGHFRRRRISPLYEINLPHEESQEPTVSA